MFLTHLIIDVSWRYSYLLVVEPLQPFFFFFWEEGLDEKIRGGWKKGILRKKVEGPVALISLQPSAILILLIEYGVRLAARLKQNSRVVGGSAYHRTIFSV